MSRPIHRGDAGSGVWALATLALFGASTALSGCVSDPDCGVCDPENLILETVAGVNYAGKVVKLLGPECEGPECPGEIKNGNYFVERVIPCIETDEAMEAPRGAQEWCKVSPLIVNDGLQFIFNNLLDPQSVELVRKSPANPQLFEVYDWKTRIVHLEGPITRYNGDYRPGTQTQPDHVSRLVNLACIDNLSKQGQGFDYNNVDDNTCDGLFADAESKKTIPLKMRMDQDVKTYTGETDARRGQSCTTPQDGVDTCCETCDFELAVNIAKYGVTAPVAADEEPSRDQYRSPNAGNAIKCDLMGDKFAQCADFIPHVNRTEEVRKFSYAWGGEGEQTFSLPLQDKLRETHPDNRPAGLEQMTVPCDSDEDCAAKPSPNLPGMNCVGTKDGAACSGSDPECENKVCRAEWFVECRAESITTGAQGYCVDKRWSGAGVAACFQTEVPYPICTDGACTNTKSESANNAKGRRFAFADADISGTISAVEGCRAELSGGNLPAECDPFYQPGVKAIGRYDRKETLPSTARNCLCEDEPATGCADLVTSLCREDGDPSKPIRDDKKGQYALKFISKNGGVIYDPAIKGVLFLPADLGSMPRSLPEACSEDRGKGAGALNIKDGWRANDNGLIESFENFDRAMCSSSTYKIVFSEPEQGKVLQYIRDKVGNTLSGKSTYVIHTPDFHVIPGSGFPTNNLRIGACDDFELRFSNKYDMSPSNLEKLQIIELGGTDDEPVEGKLIAGGPGCAKTADDLEAGNGSVPCLSVNVRDQEIGSVRVEIDAKEFGAILQPNTSDNPVRYRFKVPGLTLADGEDVYEAMKNRPADYAGAFWDACGMPLVLSMPKVDKEGNVGKGGKAAKPDFWYDFEIDSPKCKEDLDLDGFPFSCDNAPDVFNPAQLNSDGDEAGDDVDLCPTVATLNTAADTDKDGIGNECDFCTRPVDTYNKNAAMASASEKMKVRNIPDNSDFDRDGIGDVCDNCITVANCGDFGDGPNQTAASIGDPVPFSNDSQCQVDNDDAPFIGDACADLITMPGQGAAGPVGFGLEDDFDQDGVANGDDRCPRQRVKACTEDADCGGEDVTCAAGFCSNHSDFDGDDVGDICDTCPFDKNPQQIQMGMSEENDLDGDFVGFNCETNNECFENPDARPIAFYDKIAPSGMCCTTVFPTDTLDAPRLMPDGMPLEREEVERLMMEYQAAREAWSMAMDGSEPPKPPLFVPLKADCGGEGPDKCRPLTQKVRDIPGVVNLPPGCAEAGQPLSLDSPTINGNANELYKFMCTLPQRDQDFDGIGDSCDLCKFAFDPENTLFKDANNKVWPTHGQYCNGVWGVDVAPRLLSQCGDLSEDAGMTGTDTMMSTGGETTTTGG
ncbi:thrombospondin type 3 repeat-containing protein [Nannocystis punicea]|uniref:Thrombospondin type 3 repeat-containing protein n=1 Tax=Nannocystis punicea TaxID=2995304 RepID=A0ABY7HJT8_9BACT|nr:thrombospondin type 3 repeat-containing protein [Nannocystis poenicansa]WAS99481.1 thrombospondin type 3 repeat-containing protein [Nannocystis poenicansa]